jgi:hypothetical protein
MGFLVVLQQKIKGKDLQGGSRSRTGYRLARWHGRQRSKRYWLVEVIVGGATARKFIDLGDSPGDRKATGGLRCFSRRHV